MNPLSPDQLFGVKVMATIGHVCLQWSRLEMALLGVIYALENCPIERGELIYGGLDMLPRINMTIKLAEFHKAPKRQRDILKGIRKALQDRLSDERNRAVHGVQKQSDRPGYISFTMVRFRGEARTKDLTPEQINETAKELLALGDQAWSVFDAIGGWKFGPHRTVNIAGKSGQAGPGSGFKFAQDVHASIKHLWSGII